MHSRTTRSPICPPTSTAAASAASTSRSSSPSRPSRSPCAALVEALSRRYSARLGSSSRAVGSATPQRSPSRTAPQARRRSATRTLPSSDGRSSHRGVGATTTKLLARTSPHLRHREGYRLRGVPAKATTVPSPGPPQSLSTPLAVPGVARRQSVIFGKPAIQRPLDRGTTTTIPWEDGSFGARRSLSRRPAPIRHLCSENGPLRSVMAAEHTTGLATSRAGAATGRATP
jgi:hypothetical protein